MKPYKAHAIQKFLNKMLISQKTEESRNVFNQLVAANWIKPYRVSKSFSIETKDNTKEICMKALGNSYQIQQSQASTRKINLPKFFNYCRDKILNTLTRLKSKRNEKMITIASNFLC